MGHRNDERCGLRGGRLTPIRLHWISTVRYGVPSLLSAQVEDELECVVDCSQFVESQVPRVLAQRAHVDGADHLAHHSCFLIGDDDLGVKAHSRGLGRGWADDDRRERKQVVRLNDYGEASPVLDVPAATRERDRVDVTANHGALP